MYTEDKLKEIFSKYGKIISVKIQFKPHLPDQGIAYIQFESASSAQKCIDESGKLNFRIKGYEQKLQQKNERTTIFVRNLPPNTSPEELKVMELWLFILILYYSYTIIVYSLYSIVLYCHYITIVYNHIIIYIII